RCATTRNCSRANRITQARETTWRATANAPRRDPGAAVPGSDRVAEDDTLPACLEAAGNRSRARDDTLPACLEAAGSRSRAREDTLPACVEAVGGPREGGTTSSRRAWKR